MNNWERVENEERLRLALSAAGLGTWEMDLVNNRRNWSTETLAMHGLPRRNHAGEHVDLTDEIMHPEDRVRLRSLHDELRAGRDDYVFEYRTNMPNAPQRWLLAQGKVLARTPEGPTRIVGVTADITQQKQEQLQQQYNEAQFRILADSLPQLVWIADAKGHVNYYNARHAAYFQSNAPEVKPLAWQPLIHPDDLRETTRAWARSMLKVDYYEMEHRLQMADGSFRWHLSRATPVHGQHGTIVAWFGTATDIDRLKQAETRIQSSMERLQVATDAAEMFAWEMNFKEWTMAWADNAAEVIGCAKEDLGATPDKSNLFVLEEDRQRLIDEFNRFWQSGLDRFEMEFRGNPRDGNRVYWRTAGKFIRDEQGQPERAVGVTQNVTRHIEAAAQVKLLNERLSAAEEGSGALVYDYNVAENHLWRSNNLTRILGWRVDELSSDLQSWRDLMHPDHAAKLADLDIESLLDENDHYSIEYRIRHKDGHYLWMMDTGRAYRDANGNVSRQAGTTIDITARKKSEHAQQRMANLIDLSFEPILVWHPQNGILEWNRGAEILYGFSRQEALGQDPQKLLKTKFANPIPDMLQQLRASPIWTGEMKNTARNGSTIVVESRYQLIEFDGDSVVLETNRDIRESKRADESLARMAAVAVASHDALYGATLDGIIEAWNPGAEQLMGYSQSEAIGQHISMLAHPDLHAAQMVALERVKAGETIKPFDTVRKTKDGRSIDVSLAMSPVTAPDGTVTAVSIALHDISERKEWDKRQRLMNRELSHRVKNSFAVLQAILRSTLKSSPDPQQFAAAFSGRLHSMAAAHDVLTANDWQGAELGALLRHQLSYYLSGQRIRLSGGAVNLAAEHAAPLSLIVNELATNAVKFGALSTPRGKIDISWQTKKDKNLKTIIELTWVETDGPAITAQGPRGFGTTLIEKSFASATVKTNFSPSGLEVRMSWPLDDIS